MRTSSVVRTIDAVPAGVLTGIGRAALTITGEVGACGILLWKSVRALRELPRSIPLVTEQMMRMGVDSFPLVIITAVFTGGVTAVQAAYQLKEFIPQLYLGTAIYKSVVIELGPCSRRSSSAGASARPSPPNSAPCA